jgi:RNA polymerase sigma factor (sigma-70 family)
MRAARQQELAGEPKYVGPKRLTGIRIVMGPEQLSRLVNTYAAALVLYARQWCAAPEDVVQEAFVKLASQRSPPDNVAGWLHRVVRNGALAVARAERRRRRHESAAAQRTPSWFDPASEARLDGEITTVALQTLPLEQRETLVAHLWGGLTFEQIGELSGVSSSTEHRRYLAGLSGLGERLHVPCPKNPKTSN